MAYMKDKCFWLVEAKSIQINKCYFFAAVIIGRRTFEVLSKDVHTRHMRLWVRFVRKIK